MREEEQVISNWLNAGIHGSWPREYRYGAIIVIILLSTLIRAAYFVELYDSPAAVFHKWTATDMNFFDLWGKRIADGDWLGKEAFHPVAPWHEEIARLHFQKHPAELADIQLELKRKGVEGKETKLLWDKWYGGNRFHQEPLYPYLIGTIYRFFGAKVQWIFIGQLLLGIITNLLVYLVTRNCFGDTVGAVAAILVIFCAPLIFYEFVLLRTTIIVFCSVFLMYLAQRAVEKSKGISWFILGLACGVALLTKTTFIIYTFFVFLFLMTKFLRNRKQTLLYSTLMLCGITIVIAPLILRNVIVGAPIFGFSSVAPVTFISSNVEDALSRPGFYVNYDSVERIMAKTDGKLIPAMMETLKTHDSIGSFISIIKKKLGLIFHWFEAPNNVNFYYFRSLSSVLRVLPIQFLFVAPLGLVGLIYAKKTFKQSWILYASVLAGLLPMLVFYPLSRFRAPLLVALIPFAAFSIVMILDHINTNKIHVCFTLLFVVMLYSIISRPHSQIPSEFRLRDFEVAFDLYYEPKLVEAEKSQNWDNAIGVMEEIISNKPMSVSRLEARGRSENKEESGLAAEFGRYYFDYSQYLMKAGRKQDALIQLNRAKALLGLGKKI
jgi:hypothetical protein